MIPDILRGTGKLGTVLAFMLLPVPTLAWQLATKSDLMEKALLLKNRGHAADAERLLLDLLNSIERSGPSMDLVAAVLNNLGSVTQDLGEYPAAERYYRRAMQIEQKQIHGNNADLATTLDNLGSLYFETGQIRKAETVRRRALALRLAAFGPRHPAVARVLQNLAAHKFSTGNFDEASELFKQALDIWHSTGLEQTTEAAPAINGLGVAYAQLGKLSEAADHVERALSIWRQSWGESPAAAKAEANLALLRGALGERTSADEHWSSAINTAEVCCGEANVITRDILLAYMVHLRHTDRKAEAKEIRLRVEKMKGRAETARLGSAIIDIRDLERRHRSR